MTTCCDDSMCTRTLSTINSFRPPLPFWPFAPPPDMVEILVRARRQGLPLWPPWFEARPPRLHGAAVGDSTGRGVRRGRGDGEGVGPAGVSLAPADAVATGAVALATGAVA